MAGPDNISPRVLKEVATDISPLLKLIFQESFDTGVVPDDWPTANVWPIYKKGQRLKTTDHFFFTSVCCKTMESNHKHGEENNIMYPLQHGFRKGRSCETQLIEFMDDISNNLQEGQHTDISPHTLLRLLIKSTIAYSYTNCSIMVL